MPPTLTACQRKSVAEFLAELLIPTGRWSSAQRSPLLDGLRIRLWSKRLTPKASMLPISIPTRTTWSLRRLGLKPQQEDQLACRVGRAATSILFFTRETLAARL